MRARARAHTHTRTKVEATTSAFPRWGSLRKSLLPLQDFPTLAQAPPLPEPGSSPSTECPPEQGLGGGREWAPLAAIGCVAAGRREASRCARRQPVRPSRAQHRCAPPFPPTASPAQIGETRSACEELDAARPTPSSGAGRGHPRAPIRRQSALKSSPHTPLWFSLKKPHRSVNGHLAPAAFAWKLRSSVVLQCLLRLSQQKEC
ncbi:serine-rich and transmembrane domain-containing protein 1 isoform X1 [Bos mutus]|uniref:serine-rich and transmembrane domain-containing protein 1 isoform X1 n=1 Tax=Bos mutus TaxID=72004 RepID=UPI0038B64B9B